MSPRHTVLLLLALAAVLVLPGAQCGGLPPMRRFEPLQGARLTFMPVTFVLDMDGAAQPQTFQAVLNGVDVTGWFVLQTQGDRIRATAPDVWGAGLVLLGANAFQASVQLNGSTVALATDFDTAGDPYADAVVGFWPGTRAGQGQGALPGVVLGGPHGIDLYNGSTDVLSLGLGGVLDLAFVDNAVVDGPGPDLTVFENAFLTILPGLLIGPPFSEPAIVSVSQDGVVWHTFPCADDPTLDAPWYPGCAGVTPTLSDVADPSTPHPSIPTTESIQDLMGLPVQTTLPPAGSGGDSFDLADVGLAWARYVRIEAPGFDSGLCCLDNAGPDIDAVAAVHSVPGDDADGDGIPDAVQ